MDEFVKQYKILYRKAIVDFRSAQMLYESFQQNDAALDIDVVMFHLQQCAEKCMKSVLSLHKINFPKVHDLELLSNLIEENNIPLKLDMDTLIDLNDFAVESRYSIIHDDLDNAEKYFDSIRNLMDQVEHLISKI